MKKSCIIRQAMGVAAIRWGVVSLVAVFLATFAQAQISITNGNLGFAENFDHAYTTDSTSFSDLAWTDNATLPGWYLYCHAAGTPATVTIKASLSSTSGGPIYLLSPVDEPTNFMLGARITDANGSSADTPGSGYYFALRLTNNTGATVTRFSLDYTGLQFYRSTGANSNRIVTSYQIAPASSLANITEGVWTELASLTFTAPQNGSGGDPASIATFTKPANHTDYSTDVTGLAWENGQDLWIRWYINNVPGTDQGVGIDNVNIAVAAPDLPVAPAITMQPTSGTVLGGQPIVLNVAADGTAPLTYQWNRNGTPLAGETAATLTLAAAQATDAGGYTVTITNIVGSVTSDVAAIGVTTPGQSITTDRLTYTETFNHAYTDSDAGVALPWTDNYTIPGWFLYMNATGTPASVTTQASLNGTSSGSILLIAHADVPENFALTARVADSTGSTVSTPGNGHYFVMKLTNDTGGAISQFSLGYTGVQFYRSTGANSNTVTPSYKIVEGNTPMDPVGPGWNDIEELIFTAPQNGAAGSPSSITNFNNDGNFTAFAPVTVAGLDWLPGEDLWIRWRVDNVAGTDQGVGIDDVVFTAEAPASPGKPTLISAPVSSAVDAGGSLTLSVSASGLEPFTYQWSKDGTPLAGATEATLTLSNIQPGDAGSYAVTVSNSLGSITSDAAEVWLKTGNSSIGNISIRTIAGTGDQILIAGFVLVDGAKDVLAQSPVLAHFGVSGALADPQIALFKGGTQIALNDNWGSAANKEEVRSTGTVLGAISLPEDGKDAAVLSSLDAGVYTAQVSGTGGTTGVALAEVYDAGGSGRLVNVSGRCQVGTGDDIVIAGFVIYGDQRKQMLLRGVGPALASLGVNGALQDPQITLYQSLNGESTIVATNDDWDADVAKGSAIADASLRLGAFSLPAGSKDAALLVTLQPGVYTVQLSGVGGTTGVGLIEVYDAQ